jgi:hypothetical protein
VRVVESPKQRACLHRNTWTIDPKDGIVEEKEWCRDCGKTLSIRLLYPPRR